MGGAPSRILDSPALYLGGADAVKDGSFFEANGISAVLSVGDDAPTDGLDCIQQRLHIKKDDTPDSDLSDHFGEIAEFVHGARCAGRAVYIHCHAGISRSSTACAVYLVAHLELSLRDALAHLLRCRDTVCPNPGFREQLERFEKVAAAELRAALRAAHGAALVSSDLRQVAALLCESQGAVAAQAASEWLFASNGKPVSADVFANLTDNGDGNGPYVRVHEEGDDPDEPGRRRAVCRPSELLATAETDWSGADFVPWDSLGFEAQAERLRARLQPLVYAGEAAPGGLAGLEWLCAKELTDKVEGAKGKEDSRSGAAAFTIVRDEPFFLPLWHRHYARHFASGDLHVLHHVGSADEECGGAFGEALRLFDAANVTRLVNPDFDPQWLGEVVAAKQRELLEAYNAVLFAEADELLVVAPGRGELSEYIAAFVADEASAVRCVGWEVHHDFASEPPLDPSRPVLAQRRRWHRNEKYSKALLSKVPLTWSLGFHTCEESVAQDELLVLVHLHKYDFQAFLARHEARAKYKHGAAAIANGWNAHYRAVGPQLIAAYVALPAPLEPIPDWARTALGGI